MNTLGRSRVSALQELEDYIRVNEKGLDTVTKSKLERGVYFANDSKHKIASPLSSNDSLERKLVHFVDHLKNIQKFRSAQLKQVHRLLSLEMDIEEELNSSIAPPSMAQNHLTNEEFESYLLGNEQLHEYDDNQLENFDINGTTLNASQFGRQSHLRKLNSRTGIEVSSSSRSRGQFRYANVSVSQSLGMEASSQYPSASADDCDDLDAPPPPPPVVPAVQPRSSALQPFLVYNSQSGLTHEEQQHESDVALEIRQKFEQQIRDNQLLLNSIGSTGSASTDSNKYNNDLEEQQQEEEPQPRSPLPSSPRPTTPTVTPSFTGCTVQPTQETRNSSEQDEGSDDDSDYWNRTCQQPSFIDKFEFA